MKRHARVLVSGIHIDNWQVRPMDRWLPDRNTRA